jgi:uncharacterized protein involved in type VI secretion and phage assembly
LSRVYGVISATVKQVEDAEGLGRVHLDYPWMEGQTETNPAPIATMMAGGGRGSWFMPEVGDEVLVAFYQGDVNHPYIIGFLWNGKNKPPSTDRHMRVIHSVNGHRIELYDPDIANGDQGHIRLEDAHGNFIELSNSSIQIKSVGVVSIEAKHVFINGRRVRLAPTDI